MQLQIPKIDINLLLQPPNYKKNHIGAKNQHNKNPKISHISDIKYQNGTSNVLGDDDQKQSKVNCKSNLNFVMSNNQQATARRLRYYHHKRQMHIQLREQKINRNSYKFSDTQYFYQTNGSNTNGQKQTTRSQYYSCQSNLINSATKFKKQNNFVIKNQSAHKLQSSMICDNNNGINSNNTGNTIGNGNSKSTHATNIINLNMPSAIQFIQENQVVGLNRSNRSRYRSNSSIQSNYSILTQKNNNSNKKLEKKRQMDEKKGTKHINPYTNKQYLYFLPNQKEKLKKHIEENKKRQLQYNILKPCQIYHIQLNARDHSKIQLSKQFDIANKSRPLSTRTRVVKKDSKRKFTIDCKTKQQDNTIKPWEFNLWVNEDHFV